MYFILNVYFYSTNSGIIKKRYYLFQTFSRESRSVDHSRASLHAGSVNSLWNQGEGKKLKLRVYSHLQVQLSVHVSVLMYVAVCWLLERVMHTWKIKSIFVLFVLIGLKDILNTHYAVSIYIKWHGCQMVICEGYVTW